jgi:putative ABC transport system substrate-binding protein
MRPKRRSRYLAYALALILPALAAAQSSSTQIPRIGFLAWPPCEAVLGARSSFLRGLRDFGYTPDENVTIECRSADRDYDRIAATAAELVDLKVDVIVAYSHPLARGALAATDTIPIVSVLSGDPVGSGMARSLAEPGGNLTGVSYYATELTGKRMDLLMKAIPELTSVDVLANPRLSYLPFEKDTLQAASRLGVTARIHRLGARAAPADHDMGLLVRERGLPDGLFGTVSRPQLSARPLCRPYPQGRRSGRLANRAADALQPFD